MSYAPASIAAVADFWVAHGGVNGGIVRSIAEQAKPSYHCGKDGIDYYGRTPANDYSIRNAQDFSGLTNGAAALDLSWSLANKSGLQAFSNWLITEIRSGAADTLDIVEFVWSPDGDIVYGWHRWHGNGIVAGYGDLTHRWHSHVAWNRSAQNHDKLGPFRRYFEVDDLDITAIKGEDWNLAGGVRRPYRSKPERTNTAIAGYIEPTAQPVRTIAEVSANNNNWRATKIGGKVVYLLRSDLVPLVPGGDPVVDNMLTEYIARTLSTDCTDEVKAATSPLLSRIAAARSALG